MKKITDWIKNIDEVNMVVYLVLTFLFLAFVVGGAFGIFTLGLLARRIIGILGGIVFISILVIYIKNEV